MLERMYLINVLVSRYGLIIFFLILLTSCSSDDNLKGVSPEDIPEALEANPETSLTFLSVTTNGAGIPDEPKVNGKLMIRENGQIVNTTDIGIEIRGSSSQLFPKKSYGLETWDSNGMDIDVSLLGMPEEEDWILQGPYSDKTLIRNLLIYDLSRDMNRYASRSKLVELNINGDSKGVYVFMEKLKRDNERINISKLRLEDNAGEELTGGYIIKIDKNDNGGYTAQNSFESEFAPNASNMGQKIRFLYEYPDEDDITNPQKNYISDYIGSFESILASDNFIDPVNGYESFIDVDSFIDFFILNELSNNVDGYRISTYLQKDKNEKLKMGPIWDFNLAFGNADYCSGGATDVWAYQYNTRCPGDFWPVPFWWSRFLEDPTFVTRLKERWNLLRGNTLSDAAILGKVDTYIESLNNAGAVEVNFDRWPVFGTYVWPNNFVGNSYDEEIDYLKQWITARTLWLDDSIAAL